MKNRESTALPLLLFIAGVMVCSLILLTGVPSPAEDVKFPVYSYEGAELDKVKEWEKQWVGKKIDRSNIAGVKDLLPETKYRLYNDPAWGGDYWFEIVPYRPYQPTPGDIKFTKQYAGTCTIGSDDELLNYVAGIPFPNPKTALEIAYNFDNRNWGDSYRGYQDAWLIDGKRKYDRKLILDGRFLNFSGRRDIPPTPEMPDNKKQIYWSMHSEYLEPASYKGTRALTIVWKDRARSWGSWAFSSSTRRITRRSTAQRQTSAGGTDTTYDDNLMWSWAINSMTYKLLGRKELLLARHQDQQQLIDGHREGYCLFNGGQRERINTYVIECTHKDPSYVYSKQVWYTDPESHWILYADKWDRKGKLWKAMELYAFELESLYDPAIKVPQIALMWAVDLERLHGTGTRSGIELGQTGKRFKPDYYTPKALQKYGY